MCVWCAPPLSTFHSVHVTSKTDISIVTARVRYTTRWGFLTVEISSPRQNCRPWSCDNQESQGKPINRLRVIIERPAMTIIARKHETAQVTDRWGCWRFMSWSTQEIEESSAEPVSVLSSVSQSMTFFWAVETANQTWSQPTMWIRFLMGGKSADWSGK